VDQFGALKTAEVKLGRRVLSLCILLMMVNYIE
jgi:hypothetical protein